jgi:Protein of unknown function (DUF2917)
MWNESNYMNESDYRTVRTIDLDHDQMLVFENRARTQVKVLYGGVWMTQEGDPRDYFAGSGEEVAVRSRHRAIVEALQPTRVQISAPARVRIDAAWAAASLRLLRRPLAAALLWIDVRLARAAAACVPQTRGT